MAGKFGTVVGLAATTTGSLFIPGAIADAATTDEWNTVAQCESTNNWSINTGNGYYGGLQFSASTWREFGGTAFAPRADLATKQQQITIAERVLASQGKGAWPVCGKGLGNARPAISDVSTKPVPASQQPKPATPPPVQSSQVQRSNSVQTVVSGDTLWAISRKVGIPLNTLIGLNPQIRNPDLIFAGDRINLPGGASVQVKPQSAPKHSAPTTTQNTQPQVKDTALSTQAPGIHTSVVSAAKTFLGDPYLWGGNTSRGLDCSALVQQSYKKLGIVLPRTADAQMHASRTITRAQLQPGDLAFSVDRSGHAYHVAIYIGNGQVIEAPKPGSVVSIRPLYSSLTKFGRVIS